MPPALQATSPVSRSMQALVWLVANCATYQEVVSARTAEEAYEAVHWPASRDYDFNRPAGTIDARPRAIVAHTGEWNEERKGHGSWRNDGSYDLSFEFVIPEPYRGRLCDSQIWFDNQFGNIVMEMRELSGKADSQGRQLFNWHSLTRVAGPSEGQDSLPVDPDYWFGVTMRLRWPN